MKQFTIQLLISLLLILVTTACKKDEEEKGNHLNYKGITYNLDQGVLLYYGQWFDNPNSFNFDLTLLSSGIQYNEEEDEYTGKGHGIYFELFSSSETELIPGKYIFDQEESLEPNTFKEAGFVINFDTSTEIGDVEEDIVSGSITIKVDGSTYDFIIDCKDDSGNTLTATFKGTLIFRDMTEGDFKSMGSQ